MGRLRFGITALGVPTLACGNLVDPNAATGGSDSTAETGGTTTAHTGASASGSTPTSADDDADDGADEDPSADTGFPSDVAGPGTCAFQRDIDTPSVCSLRAEASDFDVAVQWTWTGEAGADDVLAPPLVANLTDDNGDGAIDLCDVPDVVVTAFDADGLVQTSAQQIFILDGATGEVHVRIETPVSSIYPALGDLDGDGVPEVVGVTSGWEADPDVALRLVAFDHTGAIAWLGDPVQYPGGKAIELADLDADGHVEIVIGNQVFDDGGGLQWQGGLYGSDLTTTADLDDDGDLELITGHAAYRADGSAFFPDPGFGINAYPQVIDRDLDGSPEIFFADYGSMNVVSATGESLGPIVGSRGPIAAADLEGDGIPELLTAAYPTLVAYDGALSPKWQTPISDVSGTPGATVFDFFGDGTAEVVYADPNFILIIGSDGTVLYEVPRVSGSESIGYPVVADIDSDGSAELIVTSVGPEAAVTVLRDARDRWVNARRIWNQHAYHVTNVLEDGAIPAVQPQHWHTFNSFRAQARVDGDGACYGAPPPK